ncbi:MAG: alkaline phosphatase D family protein [Bacteroidales bacterium]|nr:alkaline phosphatase D family protein [Bacteroidales bacterium]
MKVIIVAGLLTVFILGCDRTGLESGKFTDSFANGINRTWIGSDYWANRLQDWQLDEGRVECITSQPNRSVIVLTCRLGSNDGNFAVSARLGLLTDSIPQNDMNWIGFRLGAKGQYGDYRDDAIYGKGLNIGITTAGRLFIGEPPVKEYKAGQMVVPYLLNELILKAEADYTEGSYKLMVSAIDPGTGNILDEIEEPGIPGVSLTGAIGLVSNFTGLNRSNDIHSCWFDDITINGEKVDVIPENSFGPILFSQYTLGRGVLKLTAQMAPVGLNESRIVEFQVKDGNRWKTMQEAEIDPDAFTAAFRIDNWNSSTDIQYRLLYLQSTGVDKVEESFRTGTIRKEPVGKDEIIVAAFTGNNDIGFPDCDITGAVTKINPDLLFFSGDQIYESVAGFGVQREPVDKATLDYLRKWYLYGWAFGDLLRDIPAIAIPDDHDVYHGNLWGAGGIAVPAGTTGKTAQDEGGYKMPAQWVRMVERTQTSHLPDPFDPTPVEQGIGVYYSELNYGGISFAILEDRKFKSAPKLLLPDALINNGWAQNREWDAVASADVSGAKLLGDRQLAFLDHWAEDWSNGTIIKVVLSQTIFANVATLPKDEYHDAIVPKLRILEKGEYAPDDRPVSDMDSNGWPQTGRNEALKRIRKAFAVHIAGDQHLGSTIQYGIDEWRDAGYALCVPSISNVWPRRWYPSTPGENRKPGTPDYTGDFIDGFGNKITVMAIANPVFTGKKPTILYDRAAGFGVVRFHKDSRDIEIECWPRFEEAYFDGEEQYPGWPVKINQMDNYARRPYGWLPGIDISGMENPVVKVYSEDSGELIYAVRILGNSYDPPVFSHGSYRIVVGDENMKKELNELLPENRKGWKRIEVVFN